MPKGDPNTIATNGVIHRDRLNQAITRAHVRIVDSRMMNDGQARRVEVRDALVDLLVDAGVDIPPLDEVALRR